MLLVCSFPYQPKIEHHHVLVRQKKTLGWLVGYSRFYHAGVLTLLLLVPPTKAYPITSSTQTQDSERVAMSFFTTKGVAPCNTLRHSTYLFLPENVDTLCHSFHSRVAYFLQIKPYFICHMLRRQQI
jgi:hypothetical protein